MNLRLSGGRFVDDDTRLRDMVKSYSSVDDGENTDKVDDVINPAHYKQSPSGVECIDVIEHMPHNIAAAVKYLWRCDLKHHDPTVDLRKAIWHISREITRRELMR